MLELSPPPLPCPTPLPLNMCLGTGAEQLVRIFADQPVYIYIRPSIYPSRDTLRHICGASEHHPGKLRAPLSTAYTGAMIHIPLREAG